MILRYNRRGRICLIEHAWVGRNLRNYNVPVRKIWLRNTQWLLKDIWEGRMKQEYWVLIPLIFLILLPGSIYIIPSWHRFHLPLISQVFWRRKLCKNDLIREVHNMLNRYLSFPRLPPLYYKKVFNLTKHWRLDESPKFFAKCE